jgi:hypothetical protein
MSRFANTRPKRIAWKAKLSITSIRRRRPAEAHRKMQETVDGNGASSDPEAGNSLSKFEKLSDLCLFGRDTLVGLEKLRTRLLDLTRNNRLLNFKYTDCLKHKC